MFSALCSGRERFLFWFECRLVSLCVGRCEGEGSPYLFGEETATLLSSFFSLLNLQDECLFFSFFFWDVCVCVCVDCCCGF